MAKTQIENFKKREVELKRMESMVADALSILNGNVDCFDDFGRLLDEAWKCKRSLSDGVSNAEINLIYEEAIKGGAIGGKILGAGGGGFMLFYVRPEKQGFVKERLRRLIHVPFHFESSGSRVVLYQPHGLG